MSVRVPCSPPPPLLSARPARGLRAAAAASARRLGLLQANVFLLQLLQRWRKLLASSPLSFCSLGCSCCCSCSSSTCSCTCCCFLCCCCCSSSSSSCWRCCLRRLLHPLRHAAPALPSCSSAAGHAAHAAGIYLLLLAGCTAPAARHPAIAARAPRARARIRLRPAPRMRARARPRPARTRPARGLRHARARMHARGPRARAPPRLPSP